MTSTENASRAVHHASSAVCKATGFFGPKEAAGSGNFNTFLCPPEKDLLLRGKGTPYGRGKQGRRPESQQGANSSCDTKEPRGKWPLHPLLLRALSCLTSITFSLRVRDLAGSPGTDCPSLRWDRIGVRVTGTY